MNEISRIRSIRLNENYEDMFRIVKEGLKRKGEDVSDNQIFLRGLEIQYLDEAKKCNTAFENLMMLSIRNLVKIKYNGDINMEIDVEEMFIRISSDVLNDNRKPEDEFMLLQEVFGLALKGRKYYDCEAVNQKGDINPQDRQAMKQLSLWESIYLFEFLRDFRLNKTVDFEKLLFKFDILQEAYDLTMAK